jgi:hypothetical protein
VRNNLIEKTEKWLAYPTGKREPHRDDFSFILYGLGRNSAE